MGRMTPEDLDRLTRRLAYAQIRRTLDRLPDRELAGIANTQDGEALEAAGVTEPLLRSAVGDPALLDPDELRRRLMDLFKPLQGRADRIRPLLDLEVPE
jgi:hypothetical protein